MLVSGEQRALDLQGLLREQKVATVPGTAFGASGEGYIRCSYATATDKIIEALRRIELFVRRQRGE